MSTAKAIIMVSVILATILFAVYGYRAVKANEKKSFGDNSATDASKKEAQPQEYSFNDIVNSITNPASA